MPPRGFKVGDRIVVGEHHSGVVVADQPNKGGRCFTGMVCYVLDHDLGKPVEDHFVASPPELVRKA